MEEKVGRRMEPRVHPWKFRGQRRAKNNKNAAPRQKNKSRPRRHVA
jgi:hypothetical protein